MSELYLRPVKLFFEDSSTEEKGLIAVDEDSQTYVYPLLANWKQSPVQYLNEAILKGNTLFKDMLRRAYLEKKRVMIGLDKFVEFYEYEHLFKKCSFYQELPDPATVLDDWKLHSPNAETTVE